MLRKDKWLKKRIVTEAGFCALLVVITSGIAWFVASYADELNTERSRLQGATQTLTMENVSLKDQIVKARDSLSLYETIMKTNRSEDFSLNREAATQLLNKLKDRYRLNSLGVNMSPIKELTDEIYKKKSGTLIMSDVTLTLSGVTDEFIYGFVQAMMQRLGGYVKVTRMSLSRTGTITNNTLLDLSKGKVPGLVNADIQFSWIGFKPNTEKPADKPAPGTDSATPAPPGGAP